MPGLAPGIFISGAFSRTLPTCRLSFVKRPGQFRLIKKTTKEDYDMARVALVTGGTRGIGAAISKALKAAGYKVAASYAGNDAAAEKFKSETGIPVYKWDVSSFDDCAAGVKKVEADLGPVDVLITLLHEMQKRDAKKGLATLCIGGGMGIAMCIARD